MLQTCCRRWYRIALFVPVVDIVPVGQFYLEEHARNTQVTTTRDPIKTEYVLSRAFLIPPNNSAREVRFSPVE